MDDPRDPVQLAAAYLRGPQTPERVRKLLRLARLGTRTEFAALLRALPPGLRAPVEAASVAVTFRGVGANP
jgi:hypothetical protein